jgi:hypothetical protein
MTSFGLYKLNFTFGNTVNTIYRVMGSPLKSTTGVYGGLLNSKGGIIYIDHEGYALEPSLSIVNGAFWGNRSWASLHNNLTGGTDTKPGKVTFRYTDSLGVTYRTYRNIDWGSSAGNQVFLLDVNEMEPCNVAETFNNILDDDCDGLIDEQSPVTLKLKAYFEGYYLGGGMMTPALFNNGFTTDYSLCDTITVELHNSNFPYYSMFNVKGILHVNGECNIVFPQAVDNQSYYIVLRHRNSITTWSATPVLLNSSIVNYSFADYQTKAYGNNLINLGDGNFAVYSGDISDANAGRGFQDGVIESQDYSDMESAVYLTLTGYVPEDITGDGIVESSDYGLMENNVYYTIFSMKP